MTDPMAAIALAWFVNDPGGTCTWQGGRIDAAGSITPTSVIATLPRACRFTPEVAVRPDGAGALVVIDEAAYFVGLGDGRATMLPLVPGPRLSVIGFDKVGAVVAQRIYDDLPLDAPARRNVEGAADLPASVAHRAVAQELALVDGQWRMARQVLTSSGYCGASELRVLDALDRSAMWTPQPSAWTNPDARTRAAMERHRPAKGYLQGEWRVITNADGRMAQWFELGDSDYALRPVLIEQEGGWVRIDPALDALHPESEDVFATVIGRYVLLSNQGTVNVLVDLRDGSAHPLPPGLRSVMPDPRPTEPTRRPANRRAIGPRKPPASTSSRLAAIG